MNPVSSLLRKFFAAHRFVKKYVQHLPLAAKAVFSISCPILLIRGSIRGRSGAVVLLYVGRHWNYDFLVDLLFEEYEIVTEQQASLFSAHTRSRRLVPDADIEIVDIGWPYTGLFSRHRAYLEFADWISMKLVLEDDWHSVVGSFRNTTRNNDLRLIRRNQYRSELTNDRGSVESFYRDMYLPSVKRRHGTASIIAPRKHVLKRAQQGKLLQIYRDDDLVMAGVIYPEDDVLYFLWQGSPHRFQECVPEGAVSALYYFGIRYAFDNKLDVVDFAGTRAFPGFGDFRFKRKWGAFVDDAFSPSSLLIRPLNNRECTIAFCEQFPLIARCDDGLEAVIVMQAETVDAVTLKQLDKYYNCGGLARIVVIAVAEKTGGEATSREFNGREFQVIQCQSEEFSRLYVERSNIVR